MEPVEISFNSKRELDDKIKGIGEDRLNADQVGQARARARKLDNDGKGGMSDPGGERITVRIDYAD